MDYDISDIISALKLNGGDAKSAVEYLAGPKAVKRAADTADESVQPAEKRQRVEFYKPEIKKFLEEKFNLSSDEAEREAIRIHEVYSVSEEKEDDSKEEVMPVAAPVDDKNLPNLNKWKGRNIVQFKTIQPYQRMPNVVQHLPHAPYYGLLLTMNNAVSKVETDRFRDEVLRQIQIDRVISNNWENKTVEQLDDQGDPVVLFKGDVNSQGGNYGRVNPETRVTLNVGMDYFYTNIYNRGVTFDYPNDVVLYAKSFIPIVDEFVRNTWPYANIPLPGPPNNILINYYADREGNIGAHNDKVGPHMDENTSPVVMISIGAQRKWRVAPQSSEVYDKKINFDTINGQITIMYEPMQQYWTHELPKLTPVPYIDSKGKKVEDRISLTYRWLRPVSRNETLSEKQKRLGRMARRPS